MRTMRIIISLICLALAILAGLLLGSKEATMQGGGIIDPPRFTGEHHVFMPTIQYSPGCPRGCLDPYEGSTSACWIKGVVTGMGDWLYYTPAMGNWCEAMLLIQFRGRWFCTEAEARANGFVKADCTSNLSDHTKCWPWPETFWCRTWREACEISPELCRFSLMERLEHLGYD